MEDLMLSSQDPTGIKPKICIFTTFIQHCIGSLSAVRERKESYKHRLERKN